MSAKAASARNTTEGDLQMSVLAQERKLFEKLRPELEARAKGQWALIRGSELIGTFPSFEDAAAEAVRRFGRGPYLIREVGAADVTFPASVVYAHMQDA